MSKLARALNVSRCPWDHNLASNSVLRAFRLRYKYRVWIQSFRYPKIHRIWERTQGPGFPIWKQKVDYWTTLQNGILWPLYFVTSTTILVDNLSQLWSSTCVVYSGVELFRECIVVQIESVQTATLRLRRERGYSRVNFLLSWPCRDTGLSANL